MRTQYDFLIGDIGLRIVGEAASPANVGLVGFRPFATELLGEPQLTIDTEVELPTDWWRDGCAIERTLIDRFDFDERVCDCVLARDTEARWFGMFPREEGERPTKAVSGDIESKLILTAAGFLGRQLES